MQDLKKSALSTEILPIGRVPHSQAKLEWQAENDGRFLTSPICENGFADCVETGLKNFEFFPLLRECQRARFAKTKLWKYETYHFGKWLRINATNINCHRKRVHAYTTAWPGGFKKFETLISKRKTCHFETRYEKGHTMQVGRQHIFCESRTFFKKILNPPLIRSFFFRRMSVDFVQSFTTLMRATGR